MEREKKAGQHVNKTTGITNNELNSTIITQGEKK